MRKIAKIAALLAAFGLALGFMSCSNGSDAPYVPQPTGLSVTVTFNPNGGTITTKTQAVPVNTATALKTASALGLARENYTFAGWGKTSDASTAAYADGATVTLTENLTLYALWTTGAAPTYTIAVTNGTATPTSAAAGATVTIKANDPEAGKVFDKWTTTTAGVTFTSETSSTTTFTMPASNVTVTATYKDATAAWDGDLSKLTAESTAAFATATDGMTITGTLGSGVNVKVSIAAGAKVTLKDVTINGTDSDSYKWAGLTCAGGATITLEGTNTVKGFYMPYPGVFVPKGKTLTIKGSGSLNASSNERGAGIGGCYKVGGISIEDGSCGTIVIEGGTITATGGMSAGIGCGNGLDCDGVTIKGGTVTATGGMYAAGIGSADKGSCGPISISGGAVTATGGTTAAGIGSGNRGSCGPISISGGTVTATGGTNAAGIGSAQTDSTCGDISISGGTVTATGGVYAAGVGTGRGDNSKCEAITVDTTVTKFMATKGEYATNSVGRARAGSCVCGTITIGGTPYADGISESPYTYPPEPTPTGIINGLFSVSETKKVYFSKGNLQATYDGSSWTWSFADHQYDAFFDAGANTLISGNGTVSAPGSVDLFCWVGEKSAFTGMAAFGITNSGTIGDYGNVAGEALKSDWGTNAISNGGNVANYGWRTLTKDEWNYVVSARADADSKKGAATVSGVKGWILLPDAWTLPAGASFTARCANGYTTNTYTAEQWAVMESAGAVFLPVTGLRNVSSMIYPDEGRYWSATVCSNHAAYDAKLTDSSFVGNANETRYRAAAVRLAKDSD